MVVSFEDLPQTPLQGFNLHFFGSERGLLATPTQCGSYRVKAEFEPWDDGAVEPVLDQLLHDRLRPERGTLPGQRSPVQPRPRRRHRRQHRRRHTATCCCRCRGRRRPEHGRDQRRSRRQGFSANVSGIPYCPESAIATLSGPGLRGPRRAGDPGLPGGEPGRHACTPAPAPERHPLNSPGKIYLAGPYKGRAALADVRRSGGVRAVRPRQRRGARGGLRRSRHRADHHASRTRSRRSSTGSRCGSGRSCSTSTGRTSPSTRPTATRSRSTRSGRAATRGRWPNRRRHFQVANCADLGFAPKLNLKLNGSTKRRGHPALRAVLNAKPGEANIAAHGGRDADDAAARQRPHRHGLHQSPVRGGRLPGGFGLRPRR